jgi:hypothetical protein
MEPSFPIHALAVVAVVAAVVVVVTVAGSPLARTVSGWLPSHRHHL